MLTRKEMDFLSEVYRPRGTIRVTGQITEGYWSDGSFGLAREVIERLWRNDVGVHSFQLSWQGPENEDATALLVIDAESQDPEEDGWTLWARVSREILEITGTSEWKITGWTTRLASCEA